MDAATQQQLFWAWNAANLRAREEYYRLCAEHEAADLCRRRRHPMSAENTTADGRCRACRNYNKRLDYRVRR